MDPLSRVLERLRPQAAGWRVIEAHDAWTIRFQPRRDIVIFGQALAGACDIHLKEGSDFQVSEGDFMLMASPQTWEMRARGGGPPVDFKALLADPARLTTRQAPSVVTRFIAGHFIFEAPYAELLARLMRPIVLIRAGDVAAERVGALLKLLSEEAEADRAGKAEVIKRLLEALLIEVLRHPGAELGRTRSGLLAGLDHPKIGLALRLMHDETGRDWSVGEIARAVGMSRSAFAARFAEVVGSPPMEYLGSWRMMLAKQALMDGTVPMTEVAELAGYRSVSAFSTGFRRSTGAPPTSYMRASAPAKGHKAFGY